MFDCEMVWKVFSELPLDVQKDVVHTYVLMAARLALDEYFKSDK